ncbi:MAG: hypothetical protein D6723_19565 [Acidobacteria bacterium]|nr:MAG: hypothetical protein D6723_19565 [Acidobacteriota bacterium]
MERVVTTAYWQSDGPQIDASVILGILDDVGEWGEVDLPERHGDLRRGRSGEPPSMDLKGAVAAYERALLEELLATSPSLRQAAQRAGLRLSTLQYKMRKLGLKWDDCLRRRFHPEHSDCPPLENRRWTTDDRRPTLSFHPLDVARRAPWTTPSKIDDRRPTLSFHPLGVARR